VWPPRFRRSNGVLCRRLILIKTSFAEPGHPGHPSKSEGLPMFVSVLITISVSMLALGLFGLAVWFVGHELEEREAAELKRGSAQRTPARQ
jgi:hypothetical protein